VVAWVTKSGHVGFVVDKMELGWVFFEYFGFPCQFSFHRLLHIHHHHHHHQSPGAGTIGQLVANVPSGLSLTSPQETKKKVIIQKNKVESSWPSKPLILDFTDYTLYTALIFSISIVTDLLKALLRNG
jgi:hypothetical protein